MAEELSMDPLRLQFSSIPTQLPIQPAELSYLFQAMMWHPSLFLELRSQIDPLCFNPHTEVHFSALWASMCDSVDKYGRYDYAILSHECDRRFTANAATVIPQMRQYLLQPDEHGLIYSTYHHTAAVNYDTKYAIALAQRFLQERAVIAPLRNILAQGDATGTYPADFSDILQRSADASNRLGALQENPAVLSMPDRETYVPEPMIYNATSLPFIDNYIYGERPGDANGLLGPFQSGKSTMLRQMAVTRAYRTSTEPRQLGERPPAVFLLSYEEPWQKFKYAVWACAARISKERLEQLPDFGLMSLDHALLPYEREMYASNRDEGAVAPTDMVGEATRWDEARLWMNESLVCLDMSGSGDASRAGTGGIDEMIAVIEKNLTERKQRCGGIYIDYAGLVCKRQLAAKNMNPDHLRHLLGGFGDALRIRLAEHLDCTVWVAHQMSGVANTRSPTTELHHADSAECKSFGENLAVCGCLGNKDRHTGCLLLNWSKSRYRAPGPELPILQISGMFAEMIDVSDKYLCNPTRRRFEEQGSDDTVFGSVDQVPVRRVNVQSAADVGEALM